MSFPKYPAYKDSGVEWLSAVPDHWRPIPIKYTALQKGALFLDGDWIESKDISADGIRYITTGNVGEGIYKEQGSGFITEETFHHLGCTEVHEGDLLISRLNNPIGRACLVPDLGARIVTSVDNVIYRPDEKFHKSFLIYLFSSKEYFEHTGNLARGATMQRISRGLLGNIRIVIPPLAEQTQIARFLDHETARIDALIEEQQRLIELLKEKRQAVISHAMTKGLDPSVPMKDSGVEWLGEVPAHWRSHRVKWLFRQSKRQGYSDMEVLSVYRDYGVVIKNSRNDNNNKTPEDLSLYQLVNPGDLVLNKMKAWQGSLGVSEHQGITSPDYVVYSPTHNEAPEFIHYSLRANHMPDVYLSISNGIRPSQWRIEPEKFEQLEFFLPSKSEQLEIVSYLESQTRKFNELILCCEQASEFFSERRSALISAAVTGKIDLRGWQPQTSTPAPLREQETA